MVNSVEKCYNLEEKGGGYANVRRMILDGYLPDVDAEFTMLLRDSEYKGSSNYEAVLERIKETSYFIEDDYVMELYTLVKKASDL